MAYNQQKFLSSGGWEVPGQSASRLSIWWESTFWFPACSVGYLLKALIPSMRGPSSWPNCFLKAALPNTTTLGIRVQCMNLERHKNSVYDKVPVIPRPEGREKALRGRWAKDTQETEGKLLCLCVRKHRQEWQKLNSKRYQETIVRSSCFIVFDHILYVLCNLLYINNIYKGKLREGLVSRDMICYKKITSGDGERTAKELKQGDELGSHVNEGAIF